MIPPRSCTVGVISLLRGTFGRLHAHTETLSENYDGVKKFHTERPFFARLRRTRPFLITAFQATDWFGSSTRIRRD